MLPDDDALRFSEEFIDPVKLLAAADRNGLGGCRVKEPELSLPIRHQERVGECQVCDLACGQQGPLGTVSAEGDCMIPKRSLDGY